MSRAHVANKRIEGQGLTTVGIDVGGTRKGFHAVALTDGRYAHGCVTSDVNALVKWCRDTVHARVIGIDAPCRWSADGRARPAERELMAKKVWCFSTPTRGRAISHPRNHFGWMLQGESIFKALEKTHALCTRLPVPDQPFCFETFPHAIAWHLTNGQCGALYKRRERRQLLSRAAIDLTELTNIDLVDAALCALTAYYAATGEKLVGYGEKETGLIVVPASFKQ